MSIRSLRAAALSVINVHAGFGAHQVSRDASQKRAAVFNLDPIGVLHQLARKSGQLILKLLGRREVVIDLDQQQADHSRHIINIDLAVGDVLRVVEIDHIDGPLFRLERRSYGLSTLKWSRS